MSVALDSDQDAAARIASTVRQIVIAGPGSGKTEVVSALVQNLVEHEGLDGIHGLIVVSFSNAAVQAVDARLREAGLEPVATSTLDALAGELLRDLTDVDPGSLSFDARIQAATRVLDEREWQRLDEVEHFIVDEVQDIVGSRADLLLSLIAALPSHAGFTLLGDPAQGIYDFQLQPDARGWNPSPTTSEELLTQTAALPGVRTITLAGQYRAATRDVRKAMDLRDAVLTKRSSGPVQEFLDALPRGGTVEETVSVARRWSGSTVFLTETNGQALLVARRIADSGERVELRRSAQEKIAHRWIADILARVDSRRISRGEFFDLCSSVSLPIEREEAWRTLRATAGGSRGADLDIRAIAGGLRSFRPLLPQINADEPSRFVVSTVHRAKGLEFDNVVLVEFPSRAGQAAQAHRADSLRSSFVAVTRARRLVLRAVGPDDRSMRRLADRRASVGRWYVGGFKKWMTLGFQVRAADVERARIDPRQLEIGQDHLQQAAGAGDPLVLSLDPARSTLELPVYAITHDGVVVGHTSTAFGEDFALRIGNIRHGHHSWPSLKGARLDSVSTAAGEPIAGAIGRNGLWLAPALSGMLDINWNGAERG